MQKLSKRYRIWAVLVGLLFVYAMSMQFQAKPATEQSEQPEVSATATATATPTPISDPSESLKLTERDKQLLDRASAFVTHYYDIGPKETEKEHTERLKKQAPYMSARFVKRLYVGLDETIGTDMSRLNQLRWTQTLTLEGKADTSRLQLERKPDSTQVKLSLPVTVRGIRPDNTEEESVRQEVEIFSTWRYGAKGWTLLGFSEVQPGTDDR